MCNLSQNIILSQNEEGQISWCKSCHNYLLVFGSCAIAFSLKDLKQFKLLLAGVSEPDYSLNVQGQLRVLLKNSGAPVGICLTRSQVDNLQQLMHEALIMNDVFQIVYK